MNEEVNKVDSEEVIQETFIEKYCCFAGRIGRETYHRKQFFLALTLLLPTLICLVLLAIVGAGTIGMVAGVLIGLFYLMCSCSIATRRLHDLGRSGAIVVVAVFLLFIISVILMGKFNSMVQSTQKDLKNLEQFFFNQTLLVPLYQLIALPFTLLISYIGLWPGQKGENEYGMPERSHRFEGLSAWEQVKREYFSFTGRLNRKWFIGILVFGMLWNIKFFGIVISPKIGLEMLSTGAWFHVLNKSKEIPLWVNGLVVFNSFIGIAFSVVLIVWFSSIVIRRVQDIGWPNIIGIGIILFFTYVSFEDVFALLDPPVVAETFEVMLQKKKIIFWLSLGILVLLAALPSSSGDNQYGVNPIEAGLLPGEKADEKESENVES